MTRRTLLLWFSFACASLVIASPPASDQPVIASMEKKLQHIEKNATLPQPDETPTRISEEEINSYIASGRVKLPKGVESARFEGQPDMVTSVAHVDFDQLRAGSRSVNPLLAIFSGVHDVMVRARARGSEHKGFVEVNSVTLDGVEIPRFALELFVQKYLQPRYPGLGMNSQFALPDKIDTAVIGSHQLTLTQKQP